MATTPQAAWAKRRQGETLVVAEHAGERWTVEDLDLVVMFTDEVSDVELATTVGRSLYAIWAIQHRLRTEGVEGVRADLVEQARRREASREQGWDFVTSFPPGWND